MHFDLNTHFFIIYIARAECNYLKNFENKKEEKSHMEKNQYYEFKGDSRCEFEEICKDAQKRYRKKMIFQGTPISRWNERMNKGKTCVHKVKKMWWKVEQTFGPLPEHEKNLSWLSRFVHGYIEFDKPISTQILMDMDQPDFVYSKCEKRDAIPDGFLYQD